MMKNLYHEFKHFEGQPVRIYTDDRRVHKGIVLEAYENSVRVIEKCGKLFLIEYCHIDAVEEPQMMLHNCRKNYVSSEQECDD